MEAIKVFGWMIALPIIAGVVLFIIPAVIIRLLSRKFPGVNDNTEKYIHKYKKIGIIILVIVFVYWIFTQSGDGRVCLIRDHMGCLEWE